MRKKILLFLSVLLLASSTALAASFIDVDENHWAYSSISTLVEERVINGYEDNTFRPDAYVTRAEFAKLIGKGKEKKQGGFVDVDKSYWAYQYIMDSGIDIDRGFFYPERDITRGEILDALYERHKSDEKYYAPSIITKQYPNNKDAVSWAYSTKLMTGDEGLDLRLNENVTRAEAACLMIKLRNLDKKYCFADIVPNDAANRIYNTQFAFSTIDYEENRKITNGELSMMLSKIAYDSFEPDFFENQYETAFSGEYAESLAFLTANVWGKENNNEEFCDKFATVEDALSGLVFSATFNSAEDISFGNSLSDMSEDTQKNTLKRMMLSFAYNNGIFISADGSIDTNKAITFKELICLYIQLDDALGMKKSYNGKFVAEKTSLKVFDYPENYLEYDTILSSIPKEIYSMNLLNNPKKNSFLVKEYGDIFRDIIDMLNKKMVQEGITGKFYFFPSLTNSEKSVKMIVRLDVFKNENNKLYSDIMKINDNNVVIGKGTHYLLISTDVPLSYSFELKNIEIDRILDN